LASKNKFFANWTIEKTVFVLTAVFVILAVFWLLLSNNILLGSGADPEVVAQYKKLEEIAFVILSGSAVYLLWYNRLQQSQKAFMDQQRAQTSLSETDTRFQYLFENAPVSLWEEDLSGVKSYITHLINKNVGDIPAYLEAHPEVVTDCLKRAVVLDVNQYTLELFGAKSKADLLGNLDKIIGEAGLDLFKRELIDIARGALKFETMGVNYTLNGERIDVIVRWSVVPGFEKTYSRVLVSLVNRTDYQQVLEKLGATEERYRLLVERVSAAIFTDREDGLVCYYMSPQIEKISGYSAEEWQKNQELWENIIYSEDRERVLEENERTNQTGAAFQIEYRITHKNGQLVWISEQAVKGYDEYLKATVWNGVIMDITKSKRAEEALSQSESRFRLVLESLGEGSLLFNVQGDIIFANPAAEHLFGVETGFLSNHLLDDFFSSKDAQHLLQRISKQKPGESSSMELDIRRVDGEKRTLLLTLTAWLEPNGKLVGGLAVCHDITQRKHTEHELMFESTHDALTGLFNRRYFEARMSELAHSNGFPISLVVMDVDGLKKINDLYGHQAGDDLLRQLADVLRRGFRCSDEIARIGGDEFAVILNNTDAKGLARTIERVHKKLEEQNQNTTQMPLYVSIGSATANDPEALNMVFYLADQAMYKEKAEKRKAG
jgi:diguanylate cyclase (GGDEF)-like protein/PAS domain S-box-containing protein